LIFAAEKLKEIVVVPFAPANIFGPGEPIRFSV
jgi:hypothetical protein